VGIPEPSTRVDSFAHQLSAGQKQRAVIALDLANDPAVLIADEPTTALDVTVQAEILQLLRDLRKQLNTAILLITHNIGVVADRVLGDAPQPDGGTRRGALRVLQPVHRLHP